MSKASKTAPKAAVGVRQSMAWIHGWLGLLAGWILFAMFLTGTASYFRPEITRWMQPEIELRPVPTATAASTAVAHLQKLAPDAEQWFISLPDARTTSTRVFIRDRPNPDPDAKPAPRRSELRLNPATGEALSARDTRGGEHFYRFHFQLQIPHPWGRWLAGLCAIAMLTAIISGVITHKRIFVDFFTLRWSKGQPNLDYYEPAYADEVALLMRHAFDHMQRPDGCSVYLRLSTRAIAQTERADDGWQADALKGGYWLKAPGEKAEAAIVFTGVVAPEALEAWQTLSEDMPGIGLLNITSPDLLHRSWSAQRAARWTGGTPEASHIERLLSRLAPGAGLVTVLDGSPGALSWIGGVNGNRVSPLGTDRFGQTGDAPDLYSLYRIDAEAIVDAAAELFLGN